MSLSMALAWIWPAKRPHITHNVDIIALVSMVSWSQSKFSRSTLEGKVWAQKMLSGGLVPLWVQKNNALMGCRKSALSRKFGRVSNQESSRFKEYIIQASVIITEFVLAIQSVQLNIGYSSRNLFPAYRHSLICCQLSSVDLSMPGFCGLVAPSGAIFTEKSIKGWIEIWEREKICWYWELFASWSFQ